MKRVWVLVAALSAFLAGCQTVPVGSMLALSRVDPLAIDPVAIRAAVMHSPTLAFPDGAATLMMTVRRRDGDMVERTSFVLKNGAESDPIGAPRNRVVTVFSVLPADYDRFNAFLAGLRALRAKKAGQHSFTLGVNVKPCRTVGRGETAVSTYLRTKVDGSYVLVSRGLDIKDHATEEIPRCAHV
ncbi:MAG: hypothetical protein AAF318_09235 [Pseudomonadota bacterium]